MDPFLLQWQIILYITQYYRPYSLQTPHTPYIFDNFSCSITICAAHISLKYFIHHFKQPVSNYVSLHMKWIIKSYSLVPMDIHGISSCTSYEFFIKKCHNKFFHSLSLPSYTEVYKIYWILMTLLSASFMWLQMKIYK